MKYFIFIIIGIVATAIVAGFFVIGSPREERLRRFDDQRTQDLQYIQNQIGEFYRAKGKIPQRPEELNDQFRGVIIPADPETEANYEYRAKAPLSFELCATFNRSSGDKFPKATPAMPFTSIKPVPAEGGLFVFGGITAWGHPAGRFCFERTIDKDFFLSPEKR